MDDAALVATAPVSPAAVREFWALDDRQPNFRPVDYAWAEAHPHWQVDRRETPLPGESPGPPAPGGSFEVARQALVDYEFADPSLVRAIFDPVAPLEGRNMLLEGRFLWLRFSMPVRVSGVVERDEHRDGRPVHRFGWHYRTLQGHLERGQMDYDLLKWTDTGQVELRIRAYSRRGDIANPVVRLGFAVFGRAVQVRFQERAGRTLRALVEERTSAGPPSPGVEDAS